MEYIKVCKLDLRKPLLLNGMFYLCDNLKLIDMTNLIGDYPEDYFWCDLKKLKYYHNLQLSSLEPECTTIILPKTAPNFIKLLQISNNLTYLGNIRKEHRQKDLIKLRAKYNLINNNKTSTDFFVVEV